MKTMPRPLLALLLAGAACASPGRDWPQWRGAERDGVWRETGLLEKLPEGKLPLRWSVPIGAGYNGPSVAAGRVYVMDRLKVPKPVERVLCFDWKTGAALWTHEYDCVYSDFSYEAGPRASVTVHEGIAYALGAAGHLHALDAAGGRVLWKRDLRSEHRIRMPRWGISAAPIVEGGLLITQIGGAGEGCVVAFDRRTGEDRWKALADEASYAAPIAVDQAGRRVVILHLADRVVGLEAATGRLLWAYDMPGSQWPITISTPVVEGDLLFVTTAHVGAALLRLRSDRPAVDEVWRRNGRRPRSNDTLHSVIPTPLVMDGHVYGLHSGGELRCLELATGTRKWEDTRAVPLANHATLHLVRHGGGGNRAWLFNEKGELILARLTAAGYEELSRSKLLDPTKEQLPRGVTWSHPAFAYRHVFARNDRELVCADLSAR
jgi:outer membrane protein assembly factor BamB